MTNTFLCDYEMMSIKRISFADKNLCASFKTALRDCCDVLRRTCLIESCKFNERLVFLRRFLWFKKYQFIASLEALCLSIIRSLTCMEYVQVNCPRLWFY